MIVDSQPTAVDSDSDGLSDGFEVNASLTDPLDDGSGRDEVLACRGR
jgi:hypothetical protein